MTYRVSVECTNNPGYDAGEFDTFEKAWESFQAEMVKPNTSVVYLLENGTVIRRFGNSRLAILY